MLTLKDLIGQAQSVKDFWKLYVESGIDSGGLLILIILVFIILVKLPIKNTLEFLDYVGDKKINKYKKYIEIGEKVLDNAELLMLKGECSSIIIKNITGFKDEARQYLYMKISLLNSGAISPVNIRRLIRNTKVIPGGTPTLNVPFLFANIIIMILSWVYYALALIVVGAVTYLYYWVYPEIPTGAYFAPAAFIAAGYIYRKIYVSKKEVGIYSSSLSQIIIPNDLRS